MAKYILKTDGGSKEYFNGKRWVEPDRESQIITHDKQEMQTLLTCGGVTLVNTVFSDEELKEAEAKAKAEAEAKAKAEAEAAAEAKKKKAAEEEAAKKAQADKLAAEKAAKAEEAAKKAADGKQ